MLLLLGVVIGGSGAVAAASEPIAESYAVTQQYEQAYEPFEQRDLSNGVVFLPTTYGQWLNHPFQALRNDPGYDGDTVYAMQQRQFDVTDAYPDRDYYRYGFRGEWAPFFGQPVEPTIQRVRLTEGETVTTNVSATVPDQTESVTIRLEGDGESDSTIVSGTEPLALSLRTNTTQSRLTDERVSEPIAVPTPDRGTVTLVAFVDLRGTSAVKYRAEVPVDRTDTGMRALTPRLEVCWSERLCDGRAAYVPGTHSYDIELNATVEGTQ